MGRDKCPLRPCHSQIKHLKVGLMPQRTTCHRVSCLLEPCLTSCQPASIASDFHGAHKVRKVVPFFGPLFWRAFPGEYHRWGSATQQSTSSNWCLGGEGGVNPIYPPQRPGVQMQKHQFKAVSQQKPPTHSTNSGVPDASRAVGLVPLQRLDRLHAAAGGRGS